MTTEPAPWKTNGHTPVIAAGGTPEDQTEEPLSTENSTDPEDHAKSTAPSCTDATAPWKTNGHTPVIAPSRGFLGWLALIYCGIYAFLCAVVIGATIRMWILDYTETLPAQTLPIDENVLGWGSLGLFLVLTLTVTWKSLGGLCFEIPTALFNTFLLFKCTERYIVVLAVIMCILFVVCSWRVGQDEDARLASKQKDD